VLPGTGKEEMEMTREWPRNKEMVWERGRKWPGMRSGAYKAPLTFGSNT